MKTQVVFKMAVALLMSFSVGRSFGQEIMRTDTLSTVYIYGNTAVNKEVQHAFNKHFRDAVNPRWYAMDQNFLVKFMSKDQKNHDLYDPKGAIIYHITYGNEQTMPKDIVAQIKTQYPADDIVTAINVKQDQRDIWVLNVKDKGDLVLVRYEDGQIDEVDRIHDASI